MSHEGFQTGSSIIPVRKFIDAKIFTLLINNELFRKLIYTMQNIKKLATCCAVNLIRLVSISTSYYI